ncbi:protein phosphatase 2C family protein [Striga asiatica]|uniref:Protein phosphatase 2C family protein n=1 Tax=Striga asiatica TaxID=4170 RepID=A0A5A7Q7A2_STRAF|nr:protein phosphatase 2C family protein [Striga asiatica]
MRTQFFHPFCHCFDASRLNTVFFSIIPNRTKHLVSRQEPNPRPSTNPGVNRNAESSFILHQSNSNQSFSLRLAAEANLTGVEKIHPQYLRMAVAGLIPCLVEPVPLSSTGDRLIVSSDGVWDPLYAETAFKCCRGMPADAAGSQIVKEAVQVKSLRDDMTCIVVVIECDYFFIFTGVKSKDSTPGSYLKED